MFGLTYPIADDSEWSAWDLFGMGYIPHNIIIDHTMTVRYTDYGFDQKAVLDAIEDALDGVYQMLGIPRLGIESYEISTLQENDYDGVLNPGEGGVISVTIMNEGGFATATDVTCTISADDPDISIMPSSFAVSGDLEAGSSISNDEDPFVFEIAADAPQKTIPVTLTVSAANSEGFKTTQTLNVKVLLAQAGFPFSTASVVHTAPIVYDIDGDGENEVVAGTDDYSVYAVGSDGTLEWTYVTGGSIKSSPAVADLEGDGDVEIVVAADNSAVYILNGDGSLQAEYTVSGLISTTVLKDLDSDGDLEIIFVNSPGSLFVINHDGTEFESFPVAVGDGPLLRAPSAGDLDGDGNAEIVLGTLRSNVWAYSADGEPLDGFPYVADDKVYAETALADLDGNGTSEIIIGTESGKLEVIDHTAELVWSYDADDKIRISPAVTDMDQDGDLELFFGTVSGSIYGLSNEGNDLGGWPLLTEKELISEPVFFDMNNDDVAEIVIALSDSSVWAYYSDGEVVKNFPVTFERPVAAGLFIGDVDGDGDAEVATGTTRAIEVVDVKTKAGKSKFWSMYRGGLERTGDFADAGLLSVASSAKALPDAFRLLQNYPNPFNPETTIRYDLPQSSRVSLIIYDLMGRKVRTLVNAEQQPGYKRVIWDATDDMGRQVSSGIYIYRITAGKMTLSSKMVLLR